VTDKNRDRFFILFTKSKSKEGLSFHEYAELELLTSERNEEVLKKSPWMNKYLRRGEYEKN
jgi:hypothetical protein